MPLDTSSAMCLESSDVSGLLTYYALLHVINPGLIRLQLVFRWLASYHDSMALLFWATAILRASLPYRWYCGWLSSFSLPLDAQTAECSGQGTGCKPLHPTSSGRHLALQPACWLSEGPVPRPWIASSQRLLPGGLPMGWSAPAALLACWTQTQGQCLVAGWWLQCGRRNFSWCSRSTNSCQSFAEVRIHAHVLPARVYCSPALTKVIVFLEGRNRFANTSP